MYVKEFVSYWEKKNRGQIYDKMVAHVPRSPSSPIIRIFIRKTTNHTRIYSSILEGWHESWKGGTRGVDGPLIVWGIHIRAPSNHLCHNFNHGVIMVLYPLVNRW